MSNILIDGNTELVEIEIAKQVGDYLEEHYKGWGWMVSVHNGLVDIFNARLQNAQKGNRQYGFRLKLEDYATVSELKKKVLQAGGELLERGFQSATKYKGQEITKVDNGQLKNL